MSHTTYELARSEGKDAALLAALSPKFNSASSDHVLELPPELGSGYYRRLSPSAGLDLYVGDFTFNEDTVLSERAVRETFSLTFCFSDSLQWQKPGERCGVRLERGDCCAYRNGAFEFENRYEAGRRSFGMGIDLHPARFGPVIDHLARQGLVADFAQPSSSVRTLRAPGAIEALMRKVLNCPYPGALRALYQEARLLEAIALQVDGAVLEPRAEAAKSGRGAADGAALSRVRRAIEDRCCEQLPLSELAKLALMSESRLRREFKLRYGTSVHQYLLDRRMIRACDLLEQGRRVKDAAAEVGYSNISHFGDQFERRCGMSPSAYARRARSRES